MKGALSRQTSAGRRVLRDTRGFTLIELLIVVAIIGILAAIAVPNVTRSLATARANACKANIAVLQNATDLYYVDQGDMPDPDAFQAELVAGGYLKAEIAECPLGGEYSLVVGDVTNADGEVVGKTSTVYCSECKPEP